MHAYIDILGFAWYHFSGNRELVNTAQAGAKKAQELKETVKDKGSNPNETLNYLRSASASLIPGSAPFLGKVFDQIEEVANEHGDDVKKVFQETYDDFEKLAKDGSLNPQTATKAIDILQKRVKEIQDLAGDAGADVYNKLFSESAELRDKTSEQYKNLKDLANKAKDKKPEVQKLLKDTGAELANIFKSGDFGKKNIDKAQKLLKEKCEEAKKLIESVKKN